MKGRNTALKKYLVLYNTCEAVLWAAVLARLFFVGRIAGYRAAHDEVSTFLIWVQTSAALEVVHVALGLVPSPLLTTIMQVASRLLLVWGIDYLFPQVTSNSVAFSSMVTAWSITEILRYSYYAINLQGTVPEALMWLRYTLFYVLYPLGAGSECWLVYQSLDEAAKLSPIYKLVLQIILVTYIPGFYFLYTYMIAQRKKMFKRQGKRVAKQ
ncbi:Protein tyrosine phosphatase [Taphrina deformans PYCC 5710]|uniref:Very-long-chain (3R)-3-hydroxyacyl-CoA dehydratase n=1 Tax=Taphrina deformans (strain PYCC 5710 / ATCC 11124 / CBS 356.35 / IMI 108563 / JCM 9778 / NBRC 8474) TaxID=1097556 RepID=R4X7H4_TAPDE|nr:Protein tyrosine phosphatase [Taphrina deformans PYCC 5710]|eukprot:CCG81038.1 Protein tyrosine phosphatase [Taphrina deformans PYCC 5710]